MEKSTSYFDWESSFKKKPPKVENHIKQRKLMNSLWISNLLFKQYLKIWKERNKIPYLK
jgi:hypothetical protein